MVASKWKNRYKRDSNRGDALFVLDLYKVKQIENFKENKYNMKIRGTSSFTNEIVKYVLQTIGKQRLYLD